MRQREGVPAPRRWGRQPRRRLLAAIGAEAERRASIPIPCWEDTVNIKKNGSVRMVVEFRDYPGKRMFHCHTIEHEDSGMMGILEVEWTYSSLGRITRAGIDPAIEHRRLHHMQRRFAFPLSAAVAMAALTGSRVGMAAETPAPGTITTVAGTGQSGFSGDGGPATQARLNNPVGVAVDAAGNLFIADRLNNRVRQVSPSGMISTLARLAAAHLALDQVVNLFIKESGGYRVRKLSPAGLLTTVAGTGQAGFSGDDGPATKARIEAPGALAVDAAGNLFIADHNNHRIRKVSLDGIITTVAGSGPTGAGKGASTGDGGLATEARLNGPLGLALDRSGNLFVSEAGRFDGSVGGGYRVRKVSPDGIITTVAGSDAPGFSGDGGPASQARLNRPMGVAVDTADNLFIADADNHRIRKVDTNGMISTVAGNGTSRYAEDGMLATETGLAFPYGLAVDAVGNLLIADGHRVLKLFGVAAPGLIAGEPFPKP